MFRGLIIILCLVFCCSCQTTSKQLYQEAIAPAYTPAPVAAQIQAVPTGSAPVVVAIEETVSPTTDSCFAGAFDFMDYWGNTETTQVTMSADRGGAVKTAIEYSGLKLF